MLFIDANGFLEFYNSSKSEIKKLLPSLEELKGKIFVTEQIVWEVKRNRLSIVANNLASYLNSCRISGIRLPEHLDAVSDVEISDWNKSFSECSSQVKKENDKLHNIVEKTIRNVQEGKDSVSIELEKIFVNAKPASPDELNRARLRKEIGNPPGKKADPLGDQVSWEQLLSNYTGDAQLWVISADGDYSTLVQKNRYLNPLLYEELSKKSAGDVTVHVFDSIARGLKHYSDNQPEPISSLPPEEDLRQITSQEDLNKVSFAHSNVFPDPIACFKCGKQEGFVGPIPKPSQYGGWTYQWMCRSCGEWHDFGEPYDE